MNKNQLKDTIVESILEKKGKNLAILDIREIEQSIADYFIICDADSNTQVSAISDFIEREVRTNLKENPISREGKNNALWVLLDYGDIVVHIFKNDQRDFYKLEDLWADAKIEYIKEEE